MGSCTSSMAENTQQNAECNTISNKTKSKSMSGIAGKTLDIEGQLSKCDGLEWIPASHGHKNVKQLFTLEKELGKGMTCVVYSAIYNGKKCAIKIIPRKNELNVASVKSEANVLNQLKNKGVIKLIDIYFDCDNFYSIMERAYIDLFDVILAAKPIGEKKLSRIIRKLFATLDYLHDNNIVHRDLKPENIVFCEKEKNQPKLIDFGYGMKVENNKTYDDVMGTPPYMGKERYEIHKGWELKKSDIFALGVICFEAITQERCFEGNSKKEIHRKICNGEWKWPLHVTPSRECDDFVRRCLSIEAKDRPSCEQALSHPWLNGKKLCHKCKDKNNNNNNNNKSYNNEWNDSNSYTLGVSSNNSNSSNGCSSSWSNHTQNTNSNSNVSVASSYYAYTLYDPMNEYALSYI